MEDSVGAMFDFLYELDDKPVSTRAILVDKWIGIAVRFKWLHYTSLF
ncbi:hypothetical protein QO189_04140 [Psychrobacter sp. Arc29]